MRPERPQLKSVTQILQNEPSVLNLPIVLEISELEELLNSKIKREIYQDLSFDNNQEDNIKMTIERAGPIRVSLRGNQLHSAFPLDVWLNKRFLGFGKGKKGKNAEKGVSFQIELQFQSLYHLDERWRLITRTEMKSWKWMKKPVLNIAFVQLDVSGLMEKILDKEEKRITGLIDEAAREQVNLRKAMDKIWGDLQKPMLINRKNKKVWLKAEPFEVYSAGLQVINKKNGEDALLAPVKLHAYLSTLLGDDLEPFDQTPLPNLQLSDKAEEGFDINLLAQVPHYQINEAINENLAGKKFELEGNKVELKRVELYGSGQTLVVKVGLKGDVNGEVYLMGKPYYDSLSQAVGITDFDFDMNTEELLLQTADWLMHETFQREVAQLLTFSLKESIQQLPELISKGVAKGKAGKKVVVNIEEMRIYMKDVIVSDDQIQLLLNVKGKVKLNLRDL